MQLTNFGEKLRMFRVLKRQYMTDLAVSLKRSPAFLSAVETGAKKPSLELAAECAIALNLSPAQTAELMTACLNEIGMLKSERAHRLVGAIAALDQLGFEEDDIFNSMEDMCERRLKVA